ncbi:GNAT family N-acetyltransferase [Microvirga terricola]|uniref:GNAT family N-acetyltransferase n=1 Tax=Microvirga terricola TaxID=2719797 RepID=A0ABX0VFG7_9HYPH|nr:GNAT family N-acetyltransferase [Microvirga terricola]NIX77705.1 GNAT family N-acetyltransferase [Microvirga terricola]
MTEVALRRAQQGDAEAIARLHAQVWRETYRHLAPEAAFQALDEAARLSRWRDILAMPSSEKSVLLAEIRGRIAGFGLAGAPSSEAFGSRGEIKFLYVDSACKRQGIGRRLLAALARDLRSFGYASAALGVVVGNDPAIAFYEALGGRPMDRYTDPGPLWRSENIIYAWDDLERLIAA